VTKAPRCDLANKRIYASHDEAVAACTAEGVQPYLCRYCYRWHIGHSFKTKRAERRRQGRGNARRRRSDLS
jgi:hypothetical protein